MLARVWGSFLGLAIGLAFELASCKKRQTAKLTDIFCSHLIGPLFTPHVHTYRKYFSVFHVLVLVLHTYSGRVSAHTLLVGTSHLYTTYTSSNERV